MKKLLFFIIAAIAFSLTVSAQTKTRAKTAPKPVPKALPSTAKSAAVELDRGTVEDGQYTNKYFGIKFPIPENWEVQEEIVNKLIKDQGAKSAKGKTAAAQKALDKATNRVTVAMTVFKNPLGSEENASFVLSFEDLRSIPAVKDAVDYLQLLVTTLKQVQLPPGMKYSEIQAEKLGTRQFGFIEINKKEATQRMYVTVKKNYAVFFVFTYNDAADLETMRTMLANGNFALK